MCHDSAIGRIFYGGLATQTYIRQPINTVRPLTPLASLRQKAFMKTRFAFGATYLVVAATLANPAIYEPGHDSGVGINLWRVQASSTTVSQEIQSMHAAGFTQVALIPMAFADTTTGRISRTDNANFVTQTISDAELDAAIRTAKSLNMKVTVSPFIQTHGMQTSRAFMNFAGQAATDFWSDYNNLTASWAQIAQNAGADRYLVGSELSTLADDLTHTASWNTLISTANANFNGQIGYNETHWDYRGPNVKTMVWNNPNIDFVSISSYRDLATPAAADASGAAGDPAFVAHVKGNVTDWLDGEVLPYADTLKNGAGMPVVMGELGVIPVNRGTIDPWDFMKIAPDDSQIAYDPNESRNAFEGVLAALDGREADVMSMNFWMWGWEGGFTTEPFYLNPNTVNNPWPWKQIVPNSMAGANYLSDFLKTVPEPTSLTLLGGLSLIVVRRRK